jgi:hypothetical protein
MVAIVCLVSVALLLCILLLMRSSPATGKAPITKTAPHRGDPRPQGPRAEGLN